MKDYSPRMPTEHELRVARLMNIPTRGFCVSADLEKINAKSYKYMYDPEEYEPPEIDDFVTVDRRGNEGIQM